VGEWVGEWVGERVSAMQINQTGAQIQLLSAATLCIIEQMLQLCQGLLEWLLLQSCN